MTSSDDLGFAKLFHASPAKLAVGTMGGKLVEVNRAYGELFGYAPGEMLGKSIAELGIIPEAELRRLLGMGSDPGVAMREVEVAMRTRDGRVLDILMSADVVAIGGCRHRVATLVDVTERNRGETERRRLKEALLQEQNLEALGRLAGGVAHEFNNLLTGISGYASFLMDAMPKGDRRREDIADVLSLADRAAGLVDQLLAVGQNQFVKPKVVDLNRCVARAARTIEALVGDEIRVATNLVSAPCWIRIDELQLEQVLVALALNAREAMPRGGTLCYDTAVEAPATAFSSRHPQMRLGTVVCLAVRDTGLGMTETVKARAFEPFFSTKERGSGRGLGLGLAAVRGIVRQSGGDVELESQPGRGATVRLYFPSAPATEA